MAYLRANSYATGMPIDLLIQPDGGVIYHGSGTLTGQDLFPLEKELYASEESIRSLRYEIADLREVTEFCLSKSDMETLAFQDSHALRTNPSLKIAVVAPDAMTFGMNRMYEAYIAADVEERVQVFSDMKEARAWIDQDEDQD